MVATRNFQRMLPTLRSYARAFTGNPKINVVMADHTSTDGKTIFIAPLMQLANPGRHDRNLCDKRGANSLYLCEACANRESLMGSLYHELAHLTFGSFDSFDHGTLRAEFMGSLTTMDEQFREHVQVRMEKFLREGLDFTQIANLCSAASPFLSSVVKATEDIRINDASYKARPGVRTMRWAAEESLLHDGIQRLDGTVSHYDEYPADVQIAIGWLFKTENHDPEGYFAEEILSDLEDDQLVTLSAQAHETQSVLESMDLAFRLVKRFREMGYMVLDEEPANSEEENGDEGEESGPGQDSDVQDGEGSGSGSSGSDGEDGEADEDDSAVPGGADGADDTGDEEVVGDGTAEQDGPEDGGKPAGLQGPPEATSSSSSAEELEAAVQSLLGHITDKLNVETTANEKVALSTAVNQVLHFDTPSQAISAVNVIKDPNTYTQGWRGGGYSGGNDLKVGESIMGKTVVIARKAFSDNARGAHLRNQKSGRVSAKVLGRRAWNEDPRLFHKKTMPGKKDYFVVIGIDCSYSTASNGAHIPLKRSAMALAEVCSRLGIEFAVYGHTATGIDYGNEVNISQDMYEIKSSTDPWDDKHRDRLRTLRPVSGNVDGHNLEFYRKVADRSTATDKIIMYFTDGAMPAANYDEEKSVLEDEVRICKKKGYTLLGVGYHTTSPEEFGMDTIEIHGDEDVIKVVQHLNKRLVKA
jgi:hypothetical protein